MVDNEDGSSVRKAKKTCLAGGTPLGIRLTFCRNSVLCFPPHILITNFYLLDCSSGFNRNWAWVHSAIIITVQNNLSRSGIVCTTSGLTAASSLIGKVHCRLWATVATVYRKILDSSRSRKSKYRLSSQLRIMRVHSGHAKSTLTSTFSLSLTSTLTLTRTLTLNLTLT